MPRLTVQDGNYTINVKQEARIMEFQNKVNLYRAPGVDGSWASINPLISTPLGYWAGENGVSVATFVWAASGEENICVNTGTGAPLGFVARDIKNPLVTYNEASSQLIPEGYEVDVMVRGDFWVTPPAGATVGQKIFANTTNGTLLAGDAGGTVTDGVETDWTIKYIDNSATKALISNY